MQRVNEFSFYELATKIHALTDIPAVKLTEVWFDWWQARAALDAIFALRPLNVSGGAASELYQAITEFVPEKWEDVVATVKVVPGTEETPLSTWQTYRIREAAKKFETVLAAECQVLDTYFVSKKGNLFNC